MEALGIGVVAQPVHTEVTRKVAGLAAQASATEALLVAIGAVPAAWLRFRVVDHLQPMLPRKHWGTFGVNVIACFALGLIVALEQTCGEAARRALLLLGTGFLGSFSTLSTFIGEWRVLLLERHWWQATLLAGGSVLFGLLAMGAGLGCLVLGVVLALPPHRQRTFLWAGIGFCGSLTTFSSWMLQLSITLREGRYGGSLLVLFSTLIGGLILMSASFTVTRRRLNED